MTGSLAQKHRATEVTNRRSRDRSQLIRFCRFLLLAQIKLHCEYLQEPQLVFSDKRQCEDPRTGLAAFGPYSKTDVTRRTGDSSRHCRSRRRH